MHKYRKLAQLAYAVMVVATIWFLSPAVAEAKIRPSLLATNPNVFQPTP